MVTRPADLLSAGVTRSAMVANLAANRWQRCGRAIVLHAGPLTRDERWLAALLNCGPRSLLTAFSAAEFAGLQQWERSEIHVLAPAGTVAARVPGLVIRLHFSGQWPVARWRNSRCQELAAALIRAASSFDSVRPACAILAAAVQQQLLGADDLLRAVSRSTRTRHRAALLAAVHDIAGGSDALSEIDFVRLCRRNGLPAPIQQLRRPDSSGRNRYLDATWRRKDGRLVVVEVDGALHLNPKRWWDDQLRQNELSLAGALVLRFPSIVVRTDERAVARQLRQALQIGS